ncbi:MAG: hypothetical protein LBD75_02355 [Candidatus Peribacteria bacterium]|nr:hypothetical protein [Candidatus Peribacteria bacterium]
MYQHYQFNEQPDKHSLSLGVNATNEKWNKWLSEHTASIIQNFSLSGGLGIDKQGDKYQPIVGLAASLSGNQKLWKGGSLIYAAGVGAGWNGNFVIGPFVALGVEQEIFSGASDKRVDARAAQYL